MVTSTPKRIAKTVLDFCRTINPDASPQFVPVRPAIEAEQNECFLNVETRIKSEGGSLVNGWCIWLWPQVFIEAEHHGVWKTVEGKLIDVSPKPQNEKKIVFLEDPSFAFSEVTFERVDNIRLNLTTDKDVQTFLDISAEYAAFIEKHSSGRIVNAPAQELASLEYAKARALKKLFPRYTKPNDLCPCGSGKKNKKCHRIGL
ncbi:SEC-C domain-containing protein [uncultured Cohaesibacter sp.]|uniref:YecA family protein n=1 Tax=uncultured Cohaesibacter sp. TaxID=1002546 RepID=UPI0029C716A2|nr:SEC-C domain-containing protein [uncultured Cohaesibacter sp.]